MTGPNAPIPYELTPEAEAFLAGLDVPDPEGAREEAALYDDLSDSLRTWARSWHATPTPAQPEASQGEPEAGL